VLLAGRGTAAGRGDPRQFWKGEAGALRGALVGELGEVLALPHKDFLRPNPLFSDLKTKVSKPKLLGLFFIKM